MEEQGFLLAAPRLEPLAENRFLGVRTSLLSSDTTWDMGGCLPARALSKPGLWPPTSDRVVHCCGPCPSGVQGQRAEVCVVQRALGPTTSSCCGAAVDGTWLFLLP